jgi:histidyl-tRNA synthetase
VNDESKATHVGPKIVPAVRGVRDILPPDTALWNRVEQTAREVFGAYGFGEIRLPIFEHRQLFARTIGLDTDIVSKEMYTFDQHRYPELENLRQQVLGTDLRFSGNDTQVLLPLVMDLHKGLKTLIDGGSLPASLINITAKEAMAAWISEPAATIEGIRLQVEDMDLGERLALRPEATASVVRAYIEHGMHTLPGSVKLYYMGPMFRRERPQKGRYRQFYQIGAEVLGQSDASSVDAEVIEMLMDYFSRLQLAGTTLFVNSIGCNDCRPVYVDKLRDALRAVKDQLGADSQRRIETNPLRVLDSKIPTEQAIIETLPRIADHLCAACTVHFDELQNELKLRGIAHELNWRLVRGLDYYTRTTFEIIAPGLGSQNAVCGGGRYDGLVELLGGPPTKGIGFAIGLDRLILSLQEQGKGAVQSGPDVFFILWIGEEVRKIAIQIARRLRDARISVEVPRERMRFGKALGLANRLGARYALILGEDEVTSGQLTLKRLADGEQRKFSAEELLAHLRGELQRR